MDIELTVEEHITQLKKNFLWLGIPLIVLFVIFFYLSPMITRFLVNYIPIENAVSLTPFESIQTSLKIAGILMLILVLPLFLFALYRFAKPALSKKVIKNTKYYVGGSILIAFVGMGFGTLIFAKLVLNSLQNYQIATPMWSIMSIISFIIVLGFSMALIMQVIIIIPALSNLGIINIGWLKQYRILFAAIIVSLCAILTPPDVISQMFMFIPFYGSFELGILLSRGGKENGNRSMGMGCNNNCDINSCVGAR